MFVIRLRGRQVAEQRNVFISHVHEDDAGLQKFKDLLAPKGIDVRDSSIHTGKFNNATDEHYIKTQILAPAINWAGVRLLRLPQHEGQ
nr:TIR domain-containing protein [Burkholderia multivorans]